MEQKTKQTFIYDVKRDSWICGPPLLTPRCCHSNCTIQSDDGSTKCIIIIGGLTDQGKVSKSTEILYLAEQNWVQGPELPVGIVAAACVALPPSSIFTCVVIGGTTHKVYTLKGAISSNVYGLDKNLNKWILLGKIITPRVFHLALPIS